MKKSYLISMIAIGLLLSGTNANAQHGRMSLGLEFGFPTGEFSKGADLPDGTPLYGGNSLGIGLTPRYEHPVGDHIGLTVTTGALFFLGVSATSTDANGDVTDAEASAVFMVPFQLGFKYYFTENQKGFYLMAETGLHFVAAASSSSTSFSDSLNTTTDDVSRTATGFSYAPELGFALEHWDFGLRYQFFTYPGIGLGTTTFEKETSTQAYIGLRAAFVFGRID